MRRKMASSFGNGMGAICMSEFERLGMGVMRMPFKSVAVALLFCAFLGPVGVLYSSVLGGIVLMAAGLVVLHHMLPGPAIVLWLISCVWGVMAANRYNKKILLMRAL